MYYGSEQCFNSGGKDGRGAYGSMFDHPYQFDNAKRGDDFDMTYFMYQKIAKMMAARRKLVEKGVILQKTWPIMQLLDYQWKILRY